MDFFYMWYYNNIFNYLIWKVTGLQEKVAMRKANFFLLLYLVASVLQRHTESIRFAN